MKRYLSTRKGGNWVELRQEDSKIALDIMENSPSVALRIGGTPDDNGQILFISSNVAAFGYTREDFLQGGLAWADLICPDDLEALCNKLDYFAQRKVDKYTTYYRIIKKNGQLVWVADNSVVTRDNDGKVLYTDCMVADHTRIVEKQQQVRDSLQQQHVLNDILKTLQDSGPNEVFQDMMDRTGKYLGISRVLLFEDDAEHKNCRAVQEWTNAGIASAVGGGKYVLNYERDLPEVSWKLNKKGSVVVDAGEIPPKSREAFLRDGVLASALFAVYQNGQRYGFVCFDECKRELKWRKDVLYFLRNVSRLMSTALMRKGNEEAIHKMAYHDQLTGLTNRYRFDMYLEKAILDARIAARFGYVLFIDLDDFKVINEGYGHDYGDALLIAVADYLREHFGDVSRIFRFGGDEYTILLGHEHAGQVQAIAEKLVQRARHPWLVMDREFYCTVSVGVVRFPDGGMESTDVIKNADIALYQAKNQGKNSYVMYNEGIDNRSVQRLETEHKMRDAIENAFAGFRVHYQPIVNIMGEVVGAEALVRWMDAAGNLMPPGDFIPLAEYLGLIVPLGEFVLREAAVQCRRINEQYPDFTMSVNVSIRQFQQHDFLVRVEEVLRNTGVNVNNIILEVTEGMLVQNMGHMQMMVDQLRGMGLRIAMDDFGTGYSSLNNMRQLPLDIIKIDRSFIKDVTRDDYAKSFIRLISDLAHSMGREVCVEGVETAAQYSYCAECKVDKIQGFYFYRPMPSEDLEHELLGLPQAVSG